MKYFCNAVCVRTCRANQANELAQVNGRVQTSYNLQAPSPKEIYNKIKITFVHCVTVKEINIKHFKLGLLEHLLSIGMQIIAINSYRYWSSFLDIV